MKVLRPFAVTGSNMTSNIVEDGTYPEYSATTSYGLSQIVISAAGAAPTHRAYQSLVTPNLGNALTNTAKWLDIGPTNRFAMFDTVSGTLTTGTSGIDVSVAVTGRADGLALLNMNAQNVRVVMTISGQTSRTNLTLYSESFDNAAWSKFLGNVTADAIITPGGTVSGDLFIPTTASGTHLLQQTVSVATSGQSRGFSVFVKAAGYTNVQLAVGSASSFFANFDLAAGTVTLSTSLDGNGAPTSATIKAYANGWYRILVAGVWGPANTGGAAYFSIFAMTGGSTSFSGDGTSGIYVWGAQVEASSAVTSYIPTTSAAVASTSQDVYDTTYSLQSDSAVTSWYQYFSEDVVYNAELVLTDLPLYTNPTMRVQITSATGTVTCGTYALGQLRDLGGTVYGARSGIQDYSRKDVDVFGNYTLTKRAFAKRNTYKVVCDGAQVDSIFNLLASIRATPVIWIGTDIYASTWTFGWARDWGIEVTYPTKSYLSIEIEGLT